MIAAIYARKSTDQSAVSDDQKSIARQLDHAREYARSKGWIVADEHVYQDDGISGAEFANRPGFLRLMNSLKPRAPFQVLVMSEESRLGREAIETAFALKQLVQAGVRVFFYLEDRERTLDSPTEKFMMSLTAFTDELERDKARQRTYDAMQRKAKAGHVTGGSCFGYRNMDVLGVDGRRSHVARVVEDEEAAVIRRIFQLCAAGHGLKAITKQLNDERARSPRAQRGRSHTWAPSSVREVLFRHVYRGEIVWNQTRKRDRWGQQKQSARPEGDWIHVPAPDLRIVTDGEWQAAHARLAAARAVYFRGTGGHRFGRPALGSVSPYLLTNLLTCGSCGGTMRVRTGTHGTTRARFYGCSGYHDRGRAVCSNGADVPMADADGVVLESLLDNVLDTDLLTAAIDEAVRLLCVSTPDDRAGHLEAELQRIDDERGRYVAAIGAGGQLPGLLEALQQREASRTALQAQLVAIRGQRPASVREAASVRADVTRLAREWRQVLIEDPTNARPIVVRLLQGRATITPLAESKRWRLTGSGTLAGLFGADIFPSDWRPHRDSNPGLGLERATS